MLIKKLEPLEAYLCQEGLVRLCTEDYKKPTNQNCKTMTMHLTNFSINKKSENYVNSEVVNDGEENDGTK